MAIISKTMGSARLPRWVLLLAALPAVFVVFAMMDVRADRRDQRWLEALRSSSEALEFRAPVARSFDDVRPLLLTARSTFDAIAREHRDAARHSPFGEQVERLLESRQLPDPADIDALRDSMLTLAWDVSQVAARRERLTTTALLIGVLVIVLVSLRAILLARDLETTQRGLRESEERMRRLSDFAFEGIAVVDGAEIIDCNSALALMLGRPRDTIVGGQPLDFVVPADRERVAVVLAAGGDTLFEARVFRGDGSIVPVEIRGRGEQIGGRPCRVAVVRDISERKLLDAARDRETEALRNLSMVDELTGLHNRRAFMALLDEELERARRLNRRALLLFCDVDGLKPINDAFGHDEGDRLLRAFAGVLRETFRENDVLARLGGDEFVVFSKNVPSDADDLVIVRLERAIETFNERTRRDYSMQVSIGAAPYEPAVHEGIGADELIASADAAMYSRKRLRRDRRSSQDGVAPVS